MVPFERLIFFRWLLCVYQQFTLEAQDMCGSVLILWQNSVVSGRSLLCHCIRFTALNMFYFLKTSFKNINGY